MAIATTDPTTGEILEEFEPLTDEQLDERIGRAAAAFAGYRLTAPEQRAGWLRAAADLLDAEGADAAATMTTEMGKTLASAKAEVAKCATALRWYAEHGPALLEPRPADAAAVGAQAAHVVHQPLGVVLAVMPWNFPLWQAMRFAAPALMAGNVGLLKHASNVPRSALYLEGLFARAGFPADVFSTLLIGAGAVERVLRDDRVVAATLTGSEAAGRAVGAVAGEVLKPVVLELGGSDPFIVMPSADLARAAAVATTARCLNNGQSCVNAKRFFVHADVAEEFTRLFVAEMGSLVVGDPREEGTDVGPLATESGRADVVGYVRDAVEKGATVLVGGEVPDGPGWYYPPTVLTGVTEEMALHAEEVFGPVAALTTVADLDEALALANGHPYGLGANLWSEDEGERERFVRDVQSGMAFVNGNVTSYPQLPFGGVKRSGFGRELADLGLHAFMNAKTVWVGAASPEQGPSRSSDAAE
jgi:succinate-semialdehyde dehydrogenase/glutarate-semialdehyde dehydrogenase